MEDDTEISRTSLERCTYRYLQQTAKAMGLPSNVKKMYLIQLINTKKYCTEEDVKLLVRRVRQERKHQARLRRKAIKKRRKKHIQQSSEISSTSNSLSPPITETPKPGEHIFIRYSPDPKYPRTLLARKYTPSSSDRVLRSFKRVKKPSYLVNNTLLSLINGSSPEEGSETNKVITKEKYTQVNKLNNGFNQRNIDSWRNGGELVPVPRSSNICSPPLARPQRRLSGVYPLQPGDVRLPNVAVRRADGSISKLNAIIQRPLKQYKYERQTNSRNQSLLTIEGSQRSHTVTNMSETPQNSMYRPSNIIEMTPNSNDGPSNLSTTQNISMREPNMSEIAQNLGYKTSSVTEMTSSYSYQAQNQTIADVPHYNFNFSSSSDEMNLSSVYKDNSSDEYAVYYHKKIRAEQVRSSRTKETARSVENECRLPKISEVFSKFNSVYCTDVTQPIFVQVDSEPQIASNPPYIPDPRVQYQGSGTLEKFYNYKIVMPEPLLQIPNMTNTRTVYCTPVISTAKAQPSSTATHNVNDVASPPRDSQPYFLNDADVQEIPRVQDFFRNFQCDEENVQNSIATSFKESSSSAEMATPQEQDLGANVTIPEMVEDALEIISQDGDYMERIGMDIRMQCILCNWAGPKIILEYHIRKEHPSDIVQCESNEVCATYTLGGLAARRLWLSQVLDHAGELYVLSAKYEDPDYFMATLSIISSVPDTPKHGSMTIYNKVTGEPFTWEGDVTELPPCMPDDNDPNCFKLQLSRMDLLPNSANLKLLNRELVLRSPTKVVVGQPELDSIHINLIVKILD